MGQANVKRWIPDIMPFLTDDDPLGVDEFATHRLPLAEAAAAYEMFQRKADGAVKIMLKPWSDPAVIIQESRLCSQHSRNLFYFSECGYP